MIAMGEEADEKKESIMLEARNASRKMQDEEDWRNRSMVTRGIEDVR